jgi:DUF1365 family protein
VWDLLARGSRATEQRALIAEHGGVRPDGPVFRLEAGRRFNPVRFYYAWHEDRLHAVIAEVTNTPWGERRSYVLDPAGGRLDKTLHVSPFMPMDQQYAWRLTEPGEQLVVHLENHAEGRGKVFDATLRLHRTERAPRRAQTLRILVSIYVQALRLKRKGAPYHAHPGKVAA